MSINLLEILQEKTGCSPIKKVDPTTQDTNQGTNQDPIPHADQRFCQAAIPAILAGLYKLSQTETGAKAIVRGNNSPNWVNTIFGTNADELVKRINAYAPGNANATENKLNDIALSAVNIINDNSNGDDKAKSIQSLLHDQRDNILPFLPAELHTGDFLEDTTIDDNTNKMEGPISSLMHKIETSFSGGEVKKPSE